MDKYLIISISSPQQTIFNGPALSLSSINSAGPFDILPEHANFITLIQNKPILIKTPSKQTVSFRFPIAIIYQYNNLVKIYTDILLEETNLFTTKP